MTPALLTNVSELKSQRQGRGHLGRGLNVIVHLLYSQSLRFCFRSQYPTVTLGYLVILKFELCTEAIYKNCNSSSRLQHNVSSWIQTSVALV